MLWVCLLLACKIEDGSRGWGEFCLKVEDCEEGLRCGLGECLLDAGSLPLGEPCQDSTECEGYGENDLITCGEPQGCEGCDPICMIDPLDAGCWDTVVCNDGSCSPTCAACDAGCCSGHGGCL